MGIESRHLTAVRKEDVERMDSNQEVTALLGIQAQPLLCVVIRSVDGFWGRARMSECMLSGAKG